MQATGLVEVAILMVLSGLPIVVALVIIALFYRKLSRIADGQDEIVKSLERIAMALSKERGAR